MEWKIKSLEQDKNLLELTIDAMEGVDTGNVKFVNLMNGLYTRNAKLEARNETLEGNNSHYKGLIQ